MIAYLEGEIILKKDKFIVLLVAGTGYKVFVSSKTALNLPKRGDQIKLFCFHNIKEDASDLYGFLDYEELEFFETLMDIHGVGPKAALEISVLGPLKKIQDRILAGDVKIFESVPGIGTKKAQTIILELTGKIKLLDGLKKSAGEPAEDTLVGLGFTRQQARQALAKIEKSVHDPEERLKRALKNLGQ